MQRPNRELVDTPHRQENPKVKSTEKTGGRTRSQRNTKWWTHQFCKDAVHPPENMVCIEVGAKWWAHQFCEDTVQSGGSTRNSAEDGASVVQVERAERRIGEDGLRAVHASGNIARDGGGQGRVGSGRRGVRLIPSEGHEGWVAVRLRPGQGRFAEKKRRLVWRLSAVAMCSWPGVCATCGWSPWPSPIGRTVTLVAA